MIVLALRAKDCFEKALNSNLWRKDPFNNRVLRFPAIVLLTRRFDPETRAFFGYTRRRPEFPGRNVVSIKRLLENEELCC